MMRAWAPMLAVAVLFTASVSAQTARDGRLLLTVTDSTGGVLPNAAVTVTSQSAPAARC